HGLIRRLKVVRGTMPFRMECFPAFNYGRDAHEIEIQDGGARLCSAGLNLALASTVPVRAESNGVVADFTLKEGETASFELHSLKHDDTRIGLSEEESSRLFKDTV